MTASRDDDDEKDGLTFARDKYSLAFDMVFLTALGNLVYTGERPKESELANAVEILETEMQDPLFRHLPPQVQEAYSALSNFAIALKDSTDLRIVRAAKGLRNAYDLGIRCMMKGRHVSQGHYNGSDPCEYSRNGLRDWVEENDKGSLSLPVIQGDHLMINKELSYESDDKDRIHGALKEVVNACRKCPYRQTLRLR